MYNKINSQISAPKKKAVFFDRDGVLNIEKNYVYRIEDFIWVNGAIEALRYVQEHNFLSIVVTNQAGIARGYYTVEDMRRLHEWMQNELINFGTKIDRFYYCPYHEQGTVEQFKVLNHPDRKPNPGMILQAAQDYNLDLKQCMLVGDKMTDIEAATNAGLRSVLFNGDDLLNTIKNNLSIS